MRRLLTFLVAAVVAFTPSYAFAQESSLFGPIIPEVCKCKGLIAPDGETIVDGAPGYGCVLQTLQNAINVGIAIAIVISILAFVYAGFLLMTSGGSAENRIRARNVLLSTVVGIMVLLGAWLVVDFVMKVVYDPTTAISSGNLGPWNDILAADPGTQCLQVTQPRPIASGVVDLIRDAIGGGSGGALPRIGQARAPCPESNPGCSVSAISAYGLTQNQARAMSCIAMTESSGDPRQVSSTGACGLFQITTRPGNWSIPSFHQGSCSTRTSCHNVTCNLQTAMLMFRERGYQPWTGKDSRGRHWNPNAVACVNQYDPGHPGTRI